MVEQNEMETEKVKMRYRERVSVRGILQKGDMWSSML
jgi:hypothetical protein